MNLKQEEARLLMECLPYIREFRGETVVIKYGGHAMLEESLKKAFALNIALLSYVGIRPVIVHGGGPQIEQMLERLSIESSFLDGQRITDAPTMEVVEMVLVGKVNQDIVNLLNQAGVRAVGLSGKDGRFMRAAKLQARSKDGQKAADMGQVGKVKLVDTSLPSALAAEGFIPVIAPVGAGEDGTTYNINADSAAGAVAAAMRAKRLILLTDVPGVLDAQDRLIPGIRTDEVESMIKSGLIRGGMIPKMQCCLEALAGGTEKAMIIDGRVENCVLLELFTDSGIGTQVV
ncbi:MAG: acetylglutamate kinase [Deltaproteobacteria bacterium]|jgi:acetylglutamate kinase|nr:acetylglutamate kinase [Deltaproteobacteria bacterium]